ncbi:MAG: ATP-grasp domain-containing protein [Desulfobulbaceae bacterium]|nr:ATP-grasp domain-containing protein [Desulfobulbaceae bacterium]
MLLSFNPAVDGDLFLWERAPWDPEILAAIRKARAIVLPQTVTREFYWLCRKNCPHVFPDYDLRFFWEGKMGDTLLFWSYGVAHPETVVFPKVESLVGEHPNMMEARKLPDFPFVIKGTLGGEGNSVWLVNNRQDLDRVLSILQKKELEACCGFVIQEYIPGLQKDLRVVVIGDDIITYWRRSDGFLHNIARGGKIDSDSDPHLQEKGKEAVRRLCARTGINLAGFDLVFPSPGGEPLFLEINYTFGRSGLGGSEAFYLLLNKAVDNWLQE